MNTSKEEERFYAREKHNIFGGFIDGRLGVERRFEKRDFIVYRKPVVGFERATWNCFLAQNIDGSIAIVNVVCVTTIDADL